MTYGTGPTGFTSILSKRYTTFRGVTTSLSVLPLLAGSAPLLVRSFVGITLATARVTLLFYMSLISIFMLGFATIVYVPKMPRGMPGRGFGCYSWAAVFLGDGLILERPETKDHQSEQKGSNDMENRVETEPLLGPKRQEIKDLGPCWCDGDSRNRRRVWRFNATVSTRGCRYSREGVGLLQCVDLVISTYFALRYHRGLGWIPVLFYFSVILLSCTFLNQFYVSMERPNFVHDLLVP